MKDTPGYEDAFDRPWIQLETKINPDRKSIICENHLNGPITYFEPTPEQLDPLVELKLITKTLWAGKCNFCNTYYWCKL